MDIKYPLNHKTIKSNACYMGRVYACEQFGEKEIYLVSKLGTIGNDRFLFIRLWDGRAYELDQMPTHGWYEVEGSFKA